MSSDGDGDETVALEPIYPFEQPGDPVTLYSGPMRVNSVNEPHGRIVMALDGDLRIRWRANDASAFGTTTIQIDHPVYGLTALPAYATRTDGRGDINPADLGDRTAPMSRVIVHWLNLPSIFPANALTAGGTTWAGRWECAAAGWYLRIDARQDLARCLEDQFGTRDMVTTHVGTVQRTDGKPFTASDVEDVLYAWQVAMSFALGRWVTPALPVGLDAAGTRVWERWVPWRCDVSGGHYHWWDTHTGDDLTAMTQHFLEAWTRTPDHDIIRHVAHHVICANHSGTTLEARVMLVHAGIEYLSWARYVLSGKRSAREHKVGTAEEHLRELLIDAGIPASIPTELDALKNLPLTGQADGPRALTWLRNRLVHPKDANEPYRVQNALLQTWQLSMEYGELLLLRYLGYGGPYLRRFPPGRWAHDSQPVPWASKDPAAATPESR